MKKLKILSVLVTIVLFCVLNHYFTPSALAQNNTQSLNVATFNVESPRFCTPDRPEGQPSETKPSIVAQHIKELAGPDLWALSEVPDRATAEVYQEAANYPGSDFNLILGTKGTCFDFLAILYNRNRMSLVEPTRELVSEVGGDRDPLAAHFRLDSDNTEFWAVANHFARGNTESRNKQARNLRAWIERQSIPVIAMGDFNMDYSIDLTLANDRPASCPGTIEAGNKAFRDFTNSSKIRWIKPQCLGDGTCPVEGTGCFLPCFNSILDFIFIGGPAADNWVGTSDIAFKSVANYCNNDSEGDTDHRPVLATLSYPNGREHTTKPNIKIIQIFPNPMGGNRVEAEREAVKIQNFGNEDIDLTNWQLRDRSNSGWNLMGEIASGQQLEIQRMNQPMSLNNDGDTIELIDAVGNIIDTVSYSDTVEGVPIDFNA